MNTPVSANPSPTAGAALLRVENLTVRFPLYSGLITRRHVGDVRAVDGVTFDVDAGETLGLVGESGCGKSTTGRAILRLIKPSAGRVLLHGDDVHRAQGERLKRVRRGMQMVFQDPYGSLDARMSAEALVREPMDIQRVGSTSERRRRVYELLEVVGLNASHGRAYPHQLSGGQRQRIGIARALALNPSLLIADEPISALDVSIQAQVINLMRRLQADLGLAFLFIAHDISVVRYLSDRIAVMYLGRIVEMAGSDQIAAHPSHPYTIALLSAAPVPNPVIERARSRIILQGDLPSASNPPPGCSFHTRCWLRLRVSNPDLCKQEVPPLRLLSSGQQVACHYAEMTTSAPEQAAATMRVVPEHAPGMGGTSDGTHPVASQR